MTAYRIGRRPSGVWTNTTPPIRGGVYRKLGETITVASASDSETEVDDDNSLASSICSCDVAPDCRRRTTTVAHKQDSEPCSSNTSVSDGEGQSEKIGEGFWKQSSHLSSLSRKQYVAERLECHADIDVEQYPSVEKDVQQEIVRKYRALHQQVRDEGLYECPYLDYGKEMLRYTALFATFLVLLRYDQYLLSAVFLGLFWVRESFASMISKF